MMRGTRDSPLRKENSWWPWEERSRLRNCEKRERAFLLQPPHLEKAPPGDNNSKFTKAKGGEVISRKDSKDGAEESAARGMIAMPDTQGEL